MRDEAHGPCPPDSVWDELAAGLRNGPAAEALIEHASWCRECSSKLRSSIEVFTQEDSVAPVRQMPLRRHAPAVSWRVGRLAVAAGLMAVFAGTGAWLWLRSARSPLAELAEVYTADRTIELRVP